MIGCDATCRAMSKLLAATRKWAMKLHKDTVGSGHVGRQIGWNWVSNIVNWEAKTRDSMHLLPDTMK